MAKFITSDNVEIYYNTKGAGKPIILIHGWSSDSSGFQIQIDELSKDHKIITYDLRGHGRSEKVDYGLTLERYGRDLKELIDFLDLDDINLVGWSMGALVGFDYIRSYGTDRLNSFSIIDMTPKLINDENWNMGLNHGSYTMEDSLKDLTIINDNWLDFATPFIKYVVPYISKEELEIAVESKRDNSPHIMAAMWLAMSVNDYRDMLKYIDIPTFIIYGKESTLYSKETAEYLKDNIKDSKIIAFEGATHYLVLEKPKELNKTLRDILK